MILLDNNYLFSIIISLLLINGFYNLAYKFRKKTDSILLINNYFISSAINYFFLINDFGKKYGLFKTLFFLIFIILILLFSIFVFFQIFLPFTYIAI